MGYNFDLGSLDCHSSPIANGGLVIYEEGRKMRVSSFKTGLVGISQLALKFESFPVASQLYRRKRRREQKWVLWEKGAERPLKGSRLPALPL